MTENWTINDWHRFDVKPDVATVTIAGVTIEVPLPMDEAWVAEHRKDGAEVIDHTTGVIYRGTVDENGDIDYLEVVLNPTNLSVEVPPKLAGMIAVREGVPFDTSRPPTPEEMVTLYEKGLSQREIATLYKRDTKSVERWARQARQALPDRMPAAKPGPRGEQAPTDKG